LGRPLRNGRDVPSFERAPPAFCAAGTEKVSYFRYCIIAELGSRSGPPRALFIVNNEPWNRVFDLRGWESLVAQLPNLWFLFDPS
jgi:hypothetical protein